MSIDYVQGVLNAVRERVECGRMEMCQGPPTLPLVQYLLPGEKVPDIVSILQVLLACMFFILKKKKKLFPSEPFDLSET